ncbi:MAG: molybdopterin cofactor-binding domain-containing protein [Opitutaceae bacterium]|jgi:xanthine dehydrogenase molybdopterin binding subunit/xanthine dehydrogenase small subunit
MNSPPVNASPAALINGFTLTINGRTVRVEGVPPTTTLLEFLRARGLTGSKRGCDEGDCGACTVALVDRDAAGRPTYRAINSCLALLPMLAGREIVTVEGLAANEHLHPVQASLVNNYGSQCGYCTPGLVVSLFEAFHRADGPGARQLSDQLCGNLCRCTGYRSIRDAALDALAGRAAADEAAEPFRARLRKPVAAPAALAYSTADGSFFRPETLADLFVLLGAQPGARLVAGATEIGVELNKKAQTFPCLISTEGVPELTRLAATPAAWRIGAAVPLTTIEEALAGEYPSLARMLRVFGSRQIRSRATLGGNLATASPIGDSAPVLLALDATLVLAAARGERTVALAEFFTGYRQTVLRPGEIIREIVLPRGDPAAAGLTRRADFLKVSKRRELDLSTVAAAFCMDVDAAGVVRRARLAYGGVAALPRRARRAEAALEGKRLADAAADVAGVLATEFQPIDDVRGSAAYRRALIVSLWEKFVAGDQSEAQEGALDFGHGAKWPDADASRALRNESGAGHVTGRALYVDDLAQRRPMLEAWPVLSTHARARLVRCDATAARRAPGVVAVLLAGDIPGVNNVGPVRADEPLLAAGEVCYHGQMIALVVGESVRACRRAAALVEVDYEPRPPVLTLAEAVAQNSFHTEPRVLARGDCAAALAAAPCRLDGEFALGGQEHFYLETHAAWAEPGENGSVLVCSSTQHPSEVQAIVAAVLGRPRHQVVTQAPRMGGGFGGKETQGNAFAALVALAALRTGRPVRLQLDRDVDMTVTGKRHPFAAKFAVGYDRDGRLRAADIALVADGGWSIDLSQAIMDRALFHLDNAYYLPAVRFSGRVAKTNVASNTAFRGFGGPQGMLVIEEIMDRIARRLGLPPEVVRARNLYHGRGETNTTHYGVELGDNRLEEIWRQVLAQARFAERRRAVDDWNRAHPRIKRGLAVTPVKFGISFTLLHYNQAGALVLLYPDGTAQVNHGGTEMGQGLHTKILGVAMRELGLPADRIRLMTTSTDKVPNTSATSASAGADLNGAAVAAACATLRDRLAPVAVRMLAVKSGAAAGTLPPWDGKSGPADGAQTAPDLVFADGQVFARSAPDVRLEFAELCRKAYVRRVSLAATGFYRTPDIHWDWTTARGRPFYYYVGAAAVTEVEVDGYTGTHRVRRVDIVEDAGESLNPGVDRGQIEGGFVQGMGWLTREELLWDHEGRLTTHSASTYQIPAFSDAPLEFHVTLLPDAAQPGVIHGSKAVGEPPFMLAISVREAIRDAVAASGAPGGEVTLASPATAEAVFWAIQRRR